MNLHETAMGQRFFNVQLPALINTLKDIAAALSRPAPSAISFPADQHFLTSLYYGEYEADVFKPDKRLAPFNQAVQQKEKALLPLLSSEGKGVFRKKTGKPEKKERRKEPETEEKPEHTDKKGKLKRYWKIAQNSLSVLPKPLRRLWKGLSLRHLTVGVRAV